MPRMPIRHPDDTKRHVIVGVTGSGKTQAALFALSHRSYDRIPWVIYNFKSDESINSIPGARRLDVDKVPVSPGIYIVEPLPSQQEEVEAQMWEIWARQNIGVYVDEGYMVGRNNRAFRAILTQGRSRRLPVIVLSQRPVWMDMFVFSEADFVQIFRLNHKKDILKVQEFVSTYDGRRLPPFHSHYYDVGDDTGVNLAPVPPIEEIHKTFRLRTEKLKKVV